MKYQSREKPNKCKSFLAPYLFRGMTPTVLRQFVSAIYRPPFGKVWLSSVCWCPSVKPGNEVESRIYAGWVKMTVQFREQPNAIFLASAEAESGRMCNFHIRPNLNVSRSYLSHLRWPKPNFGLCPHQRSQYYA